MKAEYRRRIYHQYLSTNHAAAVPATVSALTSRKAYLERIIRSTFPEREDAFILDLGCGYGALVHFARRLGFGRTTGIDGSPEQVAVAADLGIEGVKHGDIWAELSGRTGSSLDAVVCFDVLEHLDRDELVSLADEAFRVLKPGGRWIIHMPNAVSPFFGRIRYGDITHELALTQTSLGQLVFSAGFSGLDCRDDPIAVHGAKSAIRWCLWGVIRLMLIGYLAVETGNLDFRQPLTQNLLAVAWKRSDSSACVR